MKKYYCRSLVLIFIYSTAVVLFEFCIFFVVFAIGNFDDSLVIWQRCVVICIAAVGVIASVLFILSTAIKKINFSEDAISINDDIKVIGVVRRLQYAVRVKYTEIKSLSYRESRKDSLGHDVDWVFVLMPYVVLHCEDGDEKAINLYYFSRKQRLKIIDEIISRVRKVGRELNVSPVKELIQSYQAKAK